MKRERVIELWLAGFVLVAGLIVVVVLLGTAAADGPPMSERAHLSFSSIHNLLPTNNVYAFGHIGVVGNIIKRNNFEVDPLCNEKDGCYPYGDGCEERDYYCMGNETGCNYTSSNRHTDGWVDTGNTRWVDMNKCKEKEQKEQEYRDYKCSAGSCHYSINDTKWIDTGIYNTTCNYVSLAPPEITSFAPLSYVDDTVCNWRTFDVTVNQAANVSWYLNGTLVLTNEGVLEAKCTLHAEVVGEHNVTAIASNANGSDMQMWIWDVTELELPKECEGTDTCCGIYPNCGNCNEKDGCYPYGDGCEERDYYCMGTETGCNYTFSNRHTDGWVDTGNTRWVDVDKCKEKEQKEQEYRDYKCSAGCCNYSINDTKWIDTGIYNTTCNYVSLAPPGITSFAPLSYVDDTVGNWRIFNVTVNQAANVSWYLNDMLVLTNEGVLEAKCMLLADVVGEHNVTAIASNANGSDMQMWIWAVTVGLNRACGDICVNTTGWWRDGGAFNPSDTPIQAAIDNATAGETICVKDGTYTENVDVNTPLTIQSENGADSTIVNALDPNDHVFEVTADHVNIIGFTVQNASDNAGIYLYNSGYCTISDNTASNNAEGIFINPSSDCTLTNNIASNNVGRGICLFSSSNCTLTNNIASNNDYGIYLDSSRNNTLTNNIASNNDWHGIHLDYSSDNTISGTASDSDIRLEYSSNNTISNNNVNTGGIYLVYSSNNTLSGNIVSDSGSGIVLCYSDSILIENCIVEDCTYDGISFYCSANAKLRNNSISNTFYDNFGVRGTDISHFYHDIDTSNLVNGKPIYYVVEQEGLVFDGEVMDVGYLGFVSCEDILVKNLTISDNEQGVLLANTYLSKIVDSHFSSNGYGITLWNSDKVFIENCNIEYNNVGIIHPRHSFQHSSSITIKSCSLISNIDGITLTYSDNVLIENCEVSKCARSITISSSDNVTIKNSTVLDASRWGTGRRGTSWETSSCWGISISTSDNALIENCNVLNTRDSGITIPTSCSNCTIRNGVVRDSGFYGIHAQGFNNSLIEDCIVENNGYGGISLLSSSNTTLRNNTVSNNIGQYGSCGIELDCSSNITLESNSMLGNKYNFGVEGGSLSQFTHDIDTTNKVDEKPIYYWVNQHNRVIPSDAGYVGVVNSTNITVRSLTLTNNGEGLLFAYSSNSIIDSDMCSNNVVGIHLLKSSNNVIYLNNFIDNTDNVYSFDSTNTWDSPDEIAYIFRDERYKSHLGNYWSDYKDKYPDAEEIDLTGIWDTPYSIDSDKDNYPLIEPFENYSLFSYLEMFFPVLFLHSEEEFPPKLIDSMLSESDLKEPHCAWWQYIFGCGLIWSDYRSVDKKPVSISSLDDRGKKDFLDMRNADPGVWFYEVPDSSRFNEYATNIYGREAIFGDYIVLQYWFFYPYNIGKGEVLGIEFTSTHEGDWEMIQIIFDRNTKQPIRATYSFHFGGKTYEWDDISKEGTQPLVYVAKGSHGSWRTTGIHKWSKLILGLKFLTSYDYTSSDGEVLRPIVDYHNTPISDKTSWVNFKGRWGARYRYNLECNWGPNSPANIKYGDAPNRWRNPIAWANNPMPSGFSATLLSPGHLHVYDAEGNHVGLNEAGEIESEIPGTYIYLPFEDGPEAVIILTPENLSFVIEATEEGNFSFEFTRYKRENSIQTNVIYENVDVTEKTTATVNVTPENPGFIMDIDSDGDGETDLTKSPDNVSSEFIPTGDLNEDVTEEEPPEILDKDGDWIYDSIDNCPSDYNPDQIDTDSDGLGDACDPDNDNDGILDEDDNCPLIANPDQADTDLDDIGNVCDNCLTVYNPDQIDADNDDYGAACDCNDTDNAIYPGAPEICDCLDNDCDDEIDEGLGVCSVEIVIEGVEEGQIYTVCVHPTINLTGDLSAITDVNLTLLKDGEPFEPVDFSNICDPGRYELQLTATLCSGLSISEEVEFFIVAKNQAPIADADGPYTGVIGKPITFNGTGSYDPDGTIVSYEWDFDGDADFDDATGVSPTKTWDAPYSCNISLRVTDDDGATDIDSTTLTVEEAEDTTPPIISNVTATNITANSATITWDSDELSDSQVKYGTESENYTLQVHNVNNVMSHSIKITELVADITYYFVVNSTDISENSNQSEEYNFNTGTTDLKITQTWLCWPDNCTICYNVTNIGDETAPSCHNTTLYVDDVAVAQDYVPVGLAPGESYIGCFEDYTWTYTPPSDNITVCADNNESIVELDETNNCLTNIWMCGDVTGDGRVRTSDGRRIFRHLTFGDPIDNLWAADVTGDGRVRTSDGRRIFRHLTFGDPLNCNCSG